MSSGEVSEQTLEQMKDYYRARAAEYDQWFYRQGRYNRSEATNQLWFAESAEVFAALDNLAIRGDVLELAPGTGIWTERLVRTASSVTVVDASPEMLEINKAKVGSDKVHYLLADLFNWQPDRQYDVIGFGFWLSHVPVERLESFWQTVTKALKPGAKIFFVDSRREPTSTAADHQLPETGNQIMTRKLNDGSEFQIVKNFYEPKMLQPYLKANKLAVNIQQTAHYFIYGTGFRRE